VDVGTGLGLPGKADRADGTADEERCGHLRHARVQSRVAEVGLVWCYVQELLKEGLQHGSKSALGQGGGGGVLALCGGGQKDRSKDGRSCRSFQR
jgi:hypothetical protein